MVATPLVTSSQILHKVFIGVFPCSDELKSHSRFATCLLQLFYTTEELLAVGTVYQMSVSVLEISKPGTGNYPILEHSYRLSA